MGQYWTEVAVRGVVIDPLTGDPAILLQDEPASVIVTVPADPGGAESIICELEGIHRDKTHSLVYRLFIRHGMRVLRLEIGADTNYDLSAALCYLHEDNLYRLDVRPADGITLALLAGAPMFASADLISSTHRTVRSPRVQENSDLLILSPDRPTRFQSGQH
jgi:bifunctional DNase/RNase